MSFVEAQQVGFPISTGSRGALRLGPELVVGLFSLTPSETVPWIGTGAGLR